MTGKVIAFSDTFDEAITLVHESHTINNHKVPLKLLTDCKSLFYVTSKGSTTSEKRLMLDVAASREGFRGEVLSEIRFVGSILNIADGLT